MNTGTHNSKMLLDFQVIFAIMINDTTNEQKQFSGYVGKVNELMTCPLL